MPRVTAALVLLLCCQICTLATAASAETRRDNSPYRDGAAIQELIGRGAARERERLLGLARPLINDRSTLDLARDVLLRVSQNDGGLCLHQVGQMLRHLDSAWALRMLDSFGKPASGLLEGNIYWPGQFDECNSISSQGTDNNSFTGQYCKVSLPMTISNQKATLQVGVCVPSGCNATDVEALADIVVSLVKYNMTTASAECHLSNRPLSSGAIVATIVCCLFAVGLLMGTLYDASRLTYTDDDTSSLKAGKQPTINQRNESRDHTEPEYMQANEGSPLLSGNGRPQSPDPSGRIGQLLLGFSLYSNGRKLFCTAQQESTQLSSLNGIRFLSMCWVVLGHTFVYSVADSDNPLAFLNQVVRRTSFQVMVNGTVCVDSFFVLSGLLVTYVLLKEMDRKKGKLSVQEWIMLYVHRYIRLTAPYAILLMIWTCLAVYFYDGPSWPTGDSLDPVCVKYWWTNLLYINNFVPGATGTDLSCMGWTWYLANDMQFFILTPLLVWLLYRSKYAGLGATTLLVMASISICAAVSVVDSLQVGTYSAEIGSGKNAWFADYYTKPWVRFAPYGIGILLGYVLYLKKDKCSLSVPAVMAGWAMAAICCLSVLYGPYEVEAGNRSGQASPFEAAVYNSLSRPAWAIGLSWVIFACSTKNGGWINIFLSWKPFIPLARLTYCAYLIHPILLITAEYGARATFPYDDVTMTLRFLGILVLGMSLAAVVSLAFESPIMNMEKLLLPSGKRKRHQ